MHRASSALSTPAAPPCTGLKNLAILAGTSSMKLVLSMPGCTMPTAMPLGFSSTDMVTAAMFTAALLQRYAIMPPLLLSVMDAMRVDTISILPPGLAISGANALDTRSGPSVLSSKALRMASKSREANFCVSIRSSHVPGGDPSPPALLMRQWTMTPSRAAAMASPAPASVTSMPVMTLAMPTASSSGEEVRHVANTATSSPRACNCLHSSSPSPEFPPVTTTFIIGMVVAGSRLAPGCC
mmetsp:Transcript_7596/g.19338  ORF Transcript_7596/g.19338 Transcript_7596/m.19338 type:complete len:240 (-) Transcript_7596:135-854(-)